MSWSNEQKLAHLLSLPWTVVPDTSPEGDRLLRVQELPAAVGTGVSDEQLSRDFWESLRATLETYLHFEDGIPLPPGVDRLPWEAEEGATQSQAFVVRETPRFAVRIERLQPTGQHAEPFQRVPPTVPAAVV